MGGPSWVAHSPHVSQADSMLEFGQLRSNDDAVADSNQG